MPVFVTEYPQFFTAAIKGRYKLLAHEKYKDIVVNSLQFLVRDNRIKLYAFVIMPDHIHLIWQMQALIDSQDVQRDFLKFTAQRIKHDLHKNHPQLLSHFETEANDRYYQFWKRRPLSIELRTHKVYLQKLNSVHNIQVKACICILPEEYKYSSALFYQTGESNWGFLSHHRE